MEGDSAKEKKCTKCNVIKSLDEFHNDKRKNDGLNYHCKECVRDWRRRYMKEYRSQPEVAKKIKAYNERPEIKRERKRYSYEYYRRPEVMEKERVRNRERRKDESFLESRRKYRKMHEAKPEVKERLNEYRRRYMREYTKRPCVRQKTNKYLSEVRSSLSSVYMKQLLYGQSNGLLKFHEIPNHLVTVKRQSLRLKRLVKDKRDD